ncbi:MAG TPA: hypothetical protein VGF29_13635 [Hyphomicrobiaceae bacterium]|jgi:hypothetical protein
MARTDDVHLVRACLDELREPGAALVPQQTLVGRAERCLDDVVATLRRLRSRARAPSAEAAPDQGS